MLMRPFVALLPSFMSMQSSNGARMVVFLRCVGNLMSGLDRASNYFSVGTRSMEAVISCLMALSMTIMDHL
jgi:hypothetical protein